MASTDKETIILDLKVDQGSAISELERTKKSIIQLKEEQQQLTKAYKAGEVTVEEYANETVRLEAILKKNQSEYNNIQKSVTGVKTQMDKLIDSNKKISSEFQNAANNIRIAGVSVGDVTTKLASFANPATAALGIVTALGAAYARSSIGAKDLEFASSQLSFALNIATDSFASLFSSVEDGQGFFSKLTNLFISSIDPSVGALSAAAAFAKQKLEQVQRDAVLGQIAINERLQENLELRTVISDAESSIQQKQEAALKIQDNISINTKERLEFINQEIDATKTLASTQKNKEIFEFQINKLLAERSNIQKQETKETEKINKQVNAIANAEAKRTEEVKKRIKAQDEAADREFRNREVSFEDTPSGKGFDVQEQFEKDADLIAADMGLVRTSEDEKRTEYLKTNAVKDMIAEEDKRRFEENAQLLEDNFNTLAGLFSQGSDARKAFALAGIGVDTAEAIAHLTEKSEDNPLNTVTFGGAGVIQFATGLVRILANIAAAKEFLSGSFAGGGSFTTKGPAFIMVGDNPGGRERVTVEPLSGRGQTKTRGNRIAMAGGGSITAGFDDGNIVTNGATAQMQQYLSMVNSIKNLPIPRVGVDEIVKVMKRIEVKQSVAQA